MYSAIVSFDNILVNMTSLPDPDLPSPTAASGDTRVVHLVDDSAEARRLVECQLEDAGWKIRSYESGQAFLKECGAHSRGCIILDLQMPGMSGSELQQLLGSRQITMPVIFLSATANVKMTAEVMKRGAMDLIEKPFEAAELVAAVQRAMAADLAAETARIESASARERIGRLTIPRTTQSRTSYSTASSAGWPTSRSHASSTSASVRSKTTAPAASHASMWKASPTSSDCGPLLGLTISTSDRNFLSI